MGKILCLLLCVQLYLMQFTYCQQSIQYANLANLGQTGRLLGPNTNNPIANRFLTFGNGRRAGSSSLAIATALANEKGLAGNIGNIASNPNIGNTASNPNIGNTASNPNIGQAVSSIIASSGQIANNNRFTNPRNSAITSAIENIEEIATGAVNNIVNTASTIMNDDDAAVNSGPGSDNANLFGTGVNGVRLPDNGLAPTGWSNAVIGNRRVAIPRFI